MTDWIDEENAKREDEAEARERFWQVFPAVANQAWRALVERLKYDADKLNKTALSAIKGEMRINKRDLIPPDGTIYVDNQAFPALYLDVQLDTHARSIHIHQLRREVMGQKGKETDEQLSLGLSRNDDIIIKDSEGNVLSIEQTSRYILHRFLNR